MSLPKPKSAASSLLLRGRTLGLTPVSDPRTHLIDPLVTDIVQLAGATDKVCRSPSLWGEVGTDYRRAMRYREEWEGDQKNEAGAGQRPT